MLTVNQINKTYGFETILDSISFTVNAGDHVGLVGINGSGKSTLLKILAGVEKPDSGSVHFTVPNIRVGYLAQGAGFQDGITIEQVLTGGDMLEKLDGNLEYLAKELVITAGDPHLEKEYDQTLKRISALSEMLNRASGILGAFGLGSFPLDFPVDHLSGGQKTRLSLAKILSGDPQLLLLDEPTNHLDLEMLEWLEDWFTRYRGAAILVSHDRRFLDHSVGTILELDHHTHKIQSYPGNYSQYLEQKQAEIDQQRQAYSDQQEEIIRLRASSQQLRGLARFHRGGKTDTNDKFAKGFFGNRAMGTMGRAKSIEKRIEHLMTDDKVERPQRTWQMKVDFKDSMEGSRVVFTLEEVSIGYDGNILLEDLNLQLRYGQRTVLVGPNGCGKTTLLRTIAGLQPPLKGVCRLGFNVTPGFMMQDQESQAFSKNAYETILHFGVFSETEARAFLSRYMFKGDDVFIPVKNLSYGERSRLTLACMVAQGCNVLMLDEPLNYLDIPSRVQFEEALTGFEGTVFAIVHDRQFIESFATEIWEVAGKSIKTFHKDGI